MTIKIAFWVFILGWIDKGSDFVIDIIPQLLEKSMKNFCKATNTKVTFYNRDRNVIFSYPNEKQDFCDIVRECPELKKECQLCDNRAMDICSKTEDTHVYICHMNLVKAVNPIRINGQVIGYVMLGQKIEENRIDEAKKRIFEVSKKHEIDGNKLLSEMEKLDKTDISTMEAVARIMMMCTSQLYRHRIITKRGEDVPSYQISEYIYENLGGDLSIPAVCKRFHISKSKLYSITKTLVGMGFSDFVRHVRIDEGKKALKSTAKSINQIAEEIGFSDANYFIRVFRQEEGMTPSKYRKMVKNEEK